MMFHNLSRHAMLQSIGAPVAAGLGDTQLSSSVDTLGAQGAWLAACIGTVAVGGTGTVKVQQSSDDGATDAYADIAGSGFAFTIANTTQMIEVDVWRPQKRYLKLVVIRGGGGNVTIDRMVAVLYSNEFQPSPLPASVANIQVLNQPGPGTA